MGHRRIGYIGSDLPGSSPQTVKAFRLPFYSTISFQSGLLRGNDCCHINAGGTSASSTATEKDISLDRPTAVVVSDDILAATLEAVCLEMGLSIPEDLSIVLLITHCLQGLLYWDINSFQLGAEAATQMINHIEDPGLPTTKILVPHHMVERDSCCPPKN